MKKLVFSVIAAVALVSVSTVFAGNRMAATTSVVPTDTVTQTDTTVQAPAEQPVDTTTVAE